MLFDAEQEIALVLLAEICHLQRHAWHVDALVIADLPAVDDFTANIRLCRLAYR